MPYDGRNYTETKPDSQVVVDLLALRALLSGQPHRFPYGTCLLTGAADIPTTCHGKPWRPNHPRTEAMLATIRMTLGHDFIANWYDTHSKREHLDLLDRTIARERGA